MRYQGRALLGVLIIVIGLLILFGNLFEVDLGKFCWPVGIILLGILLLLRPVLARPGTDFRVALFGPVRREGVWLLGEEEIWLFLGDVRLDLSQAEIPAGETEIRVFSFIGDVKVTVPEGVAVSASTVGLLTTTRLFDRKRDSLVVPVQMDSEGYEAAERKLRLETVHLIGDVKIKAA